MEDARGSTPRGDADPNDTGLDAPGDARDHPRTRRHPGQSFRDARTTIGAAAIDAERLTGRPEETIDEAAHGVVRRTARAAGGFMLIGLGIALLPLPGPGWLVIILGLSLLPYVWAERTITQIRRRIPGVPEDGRIPTSTWVVMAAMVVTFSVVSLLFGRQIGEWLGDLWSSIFG